MHECRSFDTAAWEVIYVGSYDVSISPPSPPERGSSSEAHERAGGEACGHLTLDEG